MITTRHILDALRDTDQALADVRAAERRLAEALAAVGSKATMPPRPSPLAQANKAS